MARKRREPTIEARQHRCADGSITEMWSVRYYDATGARRRIRCSSREEADFDRARIVLAESRGEPLVTSGEPVAPDESSPTLAQFWPCTAQMRRAASPAQRCVSMSGSGTAGSSRTSATFRSTPSAPGWSPSGVPSYWRPASEPIR
jgi:hypothetical protein